ncbi:MAG: YafY family transcriptional regulator [Flavobacteriaceae bacterium]|nr:YafY family transcriptional regulator [Flavobacteriaceae bacterium]
MDKNKHIPRLSRLTAILTLLQSRRVVTAPQIAEKFDISVRTAYRDIKALEESGIPIFTEEGKGYSLIKGYTLPPIMFTEQEANALITAENLISRNKDRSLTKNHREAIIKVKAVLRYSNKDKVELLSERVFYMQNFTEETTSNCLSTVQIAITNLILIKIKYHSISKGEITNRVIEPYALYHTQENWILIAWCRLRGNYREFRLDKIQSLELLAEQFDDRNFNLMNYFNTVAEKNN